MPTGFHIHLVSDATGETLNSITRACLVQFEDVTAIEHSWTLIRTTGQMQKVLQGIQQNPGLVLYTIVDDKLRNLLVSSCRDIGATLVPVLDPVMTALAGHFGQTAKGLFYGGGFAQLGKQAVGVTCVLLYSLVVSAILAKVIDLVMGFRVAEDDEVAGIDQTEHAESGYDFTGIGSAIRLGLGGSTAGNSKEAGTPAEPAQSKVDA